MILSLNWLKELVDLEGIPAEEIAKRITLSTAEVEEVIQKGDDMQDVVVAKVVTCEKVEGEVGADPAGDIAKAIAFLKQRI